MTTGGCHCQLGVVASRVSRLTAAEFPAVQAKLARRDALARLGEIVESAQLEGLSEEVFDHAALWPGPSGR